MKHGLAKSEAESVLETAVRKADRKRLLNIIYFIDSERTHSLSLSLGGFYALAILALSLLTWSFLSLYVLFSSAKRAEEKNRQIKTLMSTIFEYQTRYDQVFEKAYPTATAPTKSAAPLEPAPATVTPAPEESRSTEAESAENPIPGPIASSSPAVASPATAALSAAADTKPLDSPSTTFPSIQDTSLSVTGENINVKFVIRNPANIERSQGFLWGIARFENRSGGSVYISAPEGMSMDHEGKLLNLGRTLRFNIRTYKAKSLLFRKPPQQQGVFKQVDIYLGDLNGTQSKHTVSVPHGVDHVDGTSGPKSDSSHKEAQKLP